MSHNTLLCTSTAAAELHGPPAATASAQLQQLHQHACCNCMAHLLRLLKDKMPHYMLLQQSCRNCCGCMVHLLRLLHYLDAQHVTTKQA
jgi:hypothetical protein